MGYWGDEREGHRHLDVLISNGPTSKVRKDFPNCESPPPTKEEYPLTLPLISSAPPVDNLFCGGKPILLFSLVFIFDCQSPEFSRGRARG